MSARAAGPVEPERPAAFTQRTATRLEDGLRGTDISDKGRRPSRPQE
jgi:hypothetical protein